MTDAVAERARQTQQILNEAHAILADDHFVYIAGDHGSGWIDKDAIFVEPRRTRQLATLLAEAVADLQFDLLCGPATGGLIVAQWTAGALGLSAVFADHDARRVGAEMRGQFILRRGYDRLVRDQRVLVVDDVVSTGHSLRETAAAVRAAGGNVIAAAALVDRGNVELPQLQVPEYRFLCQYKIPEWPADQCPLCKKGVPVNTRYAHGQDFVDQQRPAQT